MKGYIIPLLFLCYIQDVLRGGWELKYTRVLRYLIVVAQRNALGPRHFENDAISSGDWVAFIRTIWQWCPSSGFIYFISELFHICAL